MAKTGFTVNNKYFIEMQVQIKPSNNFTGISPTVTFDDAREEHLSQRNFFLEGKFSQQSRFIYFIFAIKLEN